MCGVIWLKRMARRAVEPGDGRRVCQNGIANSVGPEMWSEGARQVTDTTHTPEMSAGAEAGDPSRRDFIHIATGTFAAVLPAYIGWKFIDSMSPARDTLAASSTDFDVTTAMEGSEVRILLGGKPIFIRHRTEKEIADAQSVDVADLKDPQTDEERLVAGPDGALKPQYLVTFGSCTHLGCVPVGPNDGNTGDFGGWYCPCHASHYDTSGRVRKGPAPKNLPIPKYEYVSDAVVRISL